MRDRTILELTKQSNRAFNALALWFGISIVALLILIINVKVLEPGAAIAAISICTFGVFMSVLFAAKYARLNGLMVEDEPPDSDASDMLLFETEHSPVARLEINEGSLTRLGRYRFKRSQWRLLAKALKKEHWKWTRRHVAKAGIFTNLNARYSDLTEDMIYLGIVNGETFYVTDQGQEKLLEMAGIDIRI